LGEIIIPMKNGERFSHREQINRGAPDSPLTESDIVAKFMSNAELAVARPRAKQIRDSILAMDEPDVSSRTLAEKCAL
jgi:hypothetical protein